MGIEQYANDYEDTLSGAIATLVRPVTFNVHTGKPTSLVAPFRLRLDNEILLITATPLATQFTGTNVEGTAAALHADNAVVDQDLTVAGLNNHPGAKTTTGDIEYLDAGGNVARLPVGTNGQALVVSGGLPAWGAGGAGGGGFLDTIGMHGVLGDHFAAASLDAKWTVRAAAKAHQAATGRAGLTWLEAAMHSNENYFWTQTPASIPDVIDITAKFAALAGTGEIGICMIDNAGTGDMALVSTGAGFQQNLAHMTAYVTDAWDAQAFGTPDAGPNYSQPIWVRMLRVHILGREEYQAFFSLDGNIWAPGIGINRAITPTRIGFGRSRFGVSNTNMRLDYFNALKFANLGNDLATTPVGGGAVTATSSSTFGGTYVPASAIDGTFGGANEFALNGFTPPEWLLVTWANAQTLDTIVLWPRAGGECFGNGYIEFSDGSVIDGVVFGNSMRYFNFPLKAGITWVKFWMVGGNTSTNPGMQEVAFFRSTDV